MLAFSLYKIGKIRKGDPRERERDLMNIPEDKQFSPSSYLQKKMISGCVIAPIFLISKIWSDKLISEKWVEDIKLVLELYPFVYS